MGDSLRFTKSILSLRWMIAIRLRQSRGEWICSKTSTFNAYRSINGLLWVPEILACNTFVLILLNWRVFLAPPIPARQIHWVTATWSRFSSPFSWLKIPWKDTGKKSLSVQPGLLNFFPSILNNQDFVFSEWRISVKNTRNRKGLLILKINWEFVIPVLQA